MRRRQSFLLGVSLVFLLTGCASLTQVKTTVKDPTGRVFTVKSKSDALVELKTKDGEEIKVDNRGKQSFWEGLLQYLLVKPNINISNKGESK